MGNGSLPFFRIDPAGDDGVIAASDRHINGMGKGLRALIDGKLPFSQGKIGPMDLPFLYHFREEDRGKGIFGNQCQTAGFLVQTVDAAKDKGRACILVIEGDSIGQRIRIMVKRRVDGHTGSLIDQQQVLIFKNNRNGREDWLYLDGRSSLLQNLDQQLIAREKRSRKPGGMAV